MISVDRAVIARLIKAGQKFEILVDPVKALEVKAGKPILMEELLAIPEVFEDSKKGLKVSPSLVNKTFGTNDLEQVVTKIIKEGQVQLTTEQRTTMLDAKKKAIADLIAKRAVNPQTFVPHPPDRILRAMEQAKVKIEIEKRPEEQLETIIKAIQGIIPLHFEKIQVAIFIPADFAATASSALRAFGSMTKEEWTSDGDYRCLLELSGGAQQALYDKLNSITHGQAEVKIIKR